MMFDCRGQILRILQIIEAREEMLRQLNHFVLSGAKQDQLIMNAQNLKAQRDEELRERVQSLNEFTDAIMNRVRELIGTRKIFGSVFVFDGMDYCKVVMQEMRQLKAILLSHGIDMTIGFDSSQVSGEWMRLRSNCTPSDNMRDHILSGGLSRSILGMESSENNTFGQGGYLHPTDNSAQFNRNIKFKYKFTRESFYHTTRILKSLDSIILKNKRYQSINQNMQQLQQNLVGGSWLHFKGDHLLMNENSQHKRANKTRVSSEVRNAQ